MKKFVLLSMAFIMSTTGQAALTKKDIQAKTNSFSPDLKKIFNSANGGSQPYAIARHDFDMPSAAQVGQPSAKHAAALPIVPDMVPHQHNLSDANEMQVPSPRSLGTAKRSGIHFQLIDDHGDVATGEAVDDGGSAEKQQKDSAEIVASENKAHSEVSKSNLHEALSGGGAPAS